FEEARAATSDSMCLVEETLIGTAEMVPERTWMAPVRPKTKVQRPKTKEESADPKTKTRDSQRVNGSFVSGLVPCVLRLATCDLRLSQVHGERRATVQAARFLARVVVLRTLFSIADRPQPVGADAAAHQIVLHRVRAPVAQRQVVLGRPDVAGVP